MRVPLSWLKDYVTLDLSAKALADLLTLGGIEVEKIEPSRFSFKGVVVGEVEEVKPHPDNERLNVIRVCAGSETAEVVCGDLGCSVGMKVALAPIGSSVTDKKGKTVQIRRSKRSGVESFGLLCSAEELGLVERSEGILVLREDAPIGADLTELLEDVVFDIALTPNLGHCMSLLGLARDIGALLDQRVKKLAVQLESGNRKCDVDVEIKDRENCYRYSCRKIRGLSVGLSPEWMVRRLEQAGLRSVNNVVDATNYVMLEFGQPLHAFDAKKVEGQKISVQSTEKELSFKTLDGKQRNIPENTLMIYDKRGPIAVAGVMGGASAEVDETTTDIILEAAHFNPAAVRRGSKALGLRSESSIRFERGVDFEAIALALDRAASLIGGLGGGIVDDGKVDNIANEQRRRNIRLRLSKANRILGTKFSLDAVKAFLKRLEMEPEGERGETVVVAVPSYRNDIRHEIDVIEEIARLHGYNKIEKRRTRVVNSPIPHSPLYLLQKEVRTRLIATGLREFLTSDLIGPELAALSIEQGRGEREAIRVLRPRSIDQSILRTSLLPGMLQAVKWNFERQNMAVSAFEIGNIHFKAAEDYRERLTAAILLTGKVDPHHWGVKGEDADFFDLKGIVESLLEQLRITGECFSPTRLNGFHPGIQAEVALRGLRLGVLGEVHPDRLRRLGIEKRVYFAQLDLSDLMSVGEKEWQMSALPRFPGSTRDWTVTLDRDVAVGRVLREIQAFPSQLLQESYLLDLYESEKIGSGKRNVTFRLTYRSDKRTVEQPQVEREHRRLIDAITKKVGEFIS
ncbi:MAG: phenylalanine--tRNA ligase subunit beta [Chlamydiota bacterium]